MVVDIGGGTTEVAVSSLYATAYTESGRVAGDEAAEAVMRHLQKQYQLLVGENTAEKVKIAIGSAMPLEEPLTMNVSGKDMVSGIPRTVTVNDEEVRQAMAEPVSVIVESVRRAFEKTPPELASDVADEGLVLAGGGALIRGLDRLLARDLGVKVIVAEDPLNTVVVGAGKALRDMKTYRRVFLN